MLRNIAHRKTAIFSASPDRISSNGSPEPKVTGMLRVLPTGEVSRIPELNLANKVALAIVGKSSGMTARNVGLHTSRGRLVSPAPIKVGSRRTHESFLRNTYWIVTATVSIPCRYYYWAFVPKISDCLVWPPNVRYIKGILCHLSCDVATVV